MALPFKNKENVIATEIKEGIFLRKQKQQLTDHTPESMLLQWNKTFVVISNKLKNTLFEHAHFYQCTQLFVSSFIWLT